MLIKAWVLVIWSSTVLASALPTSNVKFLGNFGDSKSSTAKPESPKAGVRRNPRSFFYSLESFDPLEDLWTDTFFIPQPELLHFGFQPIKSHVTPDFSNGLEYPDPLLLRGHAAKVAVAYLYSKELFFEDIPHVRAILENQKQRQANGLSGNVLGSLRRQSPFHRYN